MGRVGGRAGARLGSSGGAEGIGKAAREGGEALVPLPVERGPREPLPQPMRARPRHPRSGGGARDAAGFEQRGEKDALFRGGPVGAGGGGGDGGGAGDGGAHRTG